MIFTHFHIFQIETLEKELFKAKAEVVQHKTKRNAYRVHNRDLQNKIFWLDESRMQADLKAAKLLTHVRKLTRWRKAEIGRKIRSVAMKRLTNLKRNKLKKILDKVVLMISNFKFRFSQNKPILLVPNPGSAL